MLLRQQLPYRDVERVFWIWSDQPGRDRTPFNAPDVVDYRHSTTTLAGFAGLFAYSANLSDEAAAERVQGLRATADLFEVLRDNVGAAAANMFWLMRTGSDPMSLANSLATEVRRINPEEVASQIRPMDNYLVDALAPRRFSLTLMTAFAFAALALASRRATRSPTRRSRSASRWSRSSPARCQPRAWVDS